MSLPRYPAYKDSGVAWLGEVPGHWGVRKIRWICEIKKRISGELGHDVLSITQQGIKVKDLESNDGQISMDYSKYQFVEVGDFAMNHMDLLTGYVDISNVLGVTSPDYRVFSIRDKKDCYDKYVLYLFQMGYRNKIFYAFGQGSSQLGRWRLPTEQFNDFFFPLPSVDEQQAIAAFLDRETEKIDALVAEQEKLIRLLREKRQAVISHAVTKGLNPEAKMKDFGVEWLGEVPEHWEVCSIKRMTLLITDGAHISPETEGGVYGFVSTKDISDIEIDFEGCLKTSPSSYEYLVRTGCQPSRGDVLFSKDGTIGRTVVVREQREFVVASSLIIIRPDSAVLDSTFLHYLCQSFVVTQQVEGFVKGAGLPRLSIQNLLKVYGVFPQLSEQCAIASFLDNEIAKFDELTAEAQRGIELLKERRSALISAAVTGKIDVRKLSPVLDAA
jgi:type I restriction enzyme S subunit